jgi:hypothetical protein
LVQAFLKKWWVESDFKAPNLPLSLRLEVSGCYYNSMYNNTWTKQVKHLSKQHQTQWSKSQRHFYVTHWWKKYFDIFVDTLSLYIYAIWKSIAYNLLYRDGIYFDKILVSEYKLFKKSNKANLFYRVDALRIQFSIKENSVCIIYSVILDRFPCWLFPLSYKRDLL